MVSNCLCLCLLSSLRVRDRSEEITFLQTLCTLHAMLFGVCVGVVWRVLLLCGFAHFYAGLCAALQEMGRSLERFLDLCESLSCALDHVMTPLCMIPVAGR